MLRRPAPGDNEEDILKMQEDFLRDKNKPSAQIVNLRKTEHQTTKRTNANSLEPRKPSKYALSKGLNQPEKRSRTLANNDNVFGEILEKNIVEMEEKTTDNSLANADDDNVYFPKVISSVLGDIVEKSFDILPTCETISMPATGFPVATKYDLTTVERMETSDLKNLSQNKSMGTDLCASDISVPTPTLLNLPNQSYILSSKDATSIHDENVSILNKMSEKEILEEQQKLLSNLDFNLVEFIRNKRKKETSNQNRASSSGTQDSKQENMEIETEPVKANTVDNTLWENDVLSHPQVYSWLNFDKLEKDKLEWMKGIEEMKKENPDEPYEARFDFKGYLLPYTMEYTEETKTLFHHGNESHRPGYSVLELFELTRSSVAQQKVMALNSLAGILEYNSTGIYTGIVDIPVTKIFFIIRIALDENKVNILEPALKALRNLIYNRIDEASLDALIGFEEGTYQPCLENDRSEIDEMESHESELKDFHLAEIDIIAALVRTDILQRLYYVLENVKPSFNCVQYSLQILTRLARDSVDTANKIVQMDHLMYTIIRSFIPPTSINFLFEPNIVYNGKPVLAALKLMRIISLQSKEIGEILITKYDLLRPISAYVSSGVDGTYGLRLQIEAFCILTNLLNYDLAIENAMSLFPIIITTLYKHVQGTDVFISTSVISVTHAAVVLQFINKLLYCYNIDIKNIKEQIYPLLKEGLQKWLSQVAYIDNYTCAHLRLVSSLLDCCKSVMEIENIQLPFLNDLLHNLETSNGFNIVIKNLILSSNLLSGIEDKDLCLTKNIVSLGTLITSSTRKILPILQISSSIPFLLPLFKLVLTIDNQDIRQKFINRAAEYATMLTKQPFYLTNNWFTRMEVELVYCLVKLSSLSKSSEASKDTTYALASKLCYILRVDKRCELQYVFDNIIFKKQWFTAERLFNLVSLSESDGFSKVLTNIEDIRKCYRTVINLKHIHSANIILKDWQQPILPRDWIYLPILSLYSKSQEVQTTPTVYGEHANKVAQKLAEEKELTIRCCLEWIVFNEMCFPDLLKDIDITDRFCRIMCVFLCDNSIFLDEKVKILLRTCTQILFKYKNTLNFDKELVGLHNFQDLYTQFLEQFQSVSYGDPTFASCLLVPIAQRHNVKWRKLLWSEYAGCLRALDCPASSLCYDLNEYLYPEETDESLLKSYFRAVSSNLLRPDTIAYKIAHHHVEKVKERKSVNKYFTYYFLFFAIISLMSTVELLTRLGNATASDLKILFLPVLFLYLYSVVLVRGSTIAALQPIRASTTGEVLFARITLA